MSWLFGKPKKKSQTDAGQLVNDLAEICQRQYPQLVSGEAVLSLSIQSLRLILAAFADAKSAGSLARRDAVRKEFLQKCLREVRSLKLFGTSATLLGRVELSSFENVTKLSLFKVPIHLIDMTSSLRHHVEVLLCTRSLTQLSELLKAPRSAPHSNEVERENGFYASNSNQDVRTRNSDDQNAARWNEEFDQSVSEYDSLQPESNRLGGGGNASSWDTTAPVGYQGSVDKATSELRWKALIELHVAYNTIESLDASLFYCPLLRVLDLSHNGLKQVGSAFLSLEHLEYVDLSYNFLTEFPRFSLSSQRTIRVVSLHYNMMELLSEADFDFRRFEQLVELNLAHNMISTVNVLRPLAALPRLSRFALSGNPLEFVAGERYRIRVLAHAIGPGCANSLILDGLRMTQAEIRQAERIRCAGDLVLRGFHGNLASNDRRRNFTMSTPNVSAMESVSFVDDTQTDIEDRDTEIRIRIERDARSECDSPTLPSNDALTTPGSRSKKRRTRRVVRPKAAADDSIVTNATADGLATTSNGDPPRLVTKAEIDARREQLRHIESASWLNALPLSFREALDALPDASQQPSQSLPIPAPQLVPVESTSPSTSLRVLVDPAANQSSSVPQFAAAIDPNVDLGGVADADAEVSIVLGAKSDERTDATTPEPLALAESSPISATHAANQNSETAHSDDQPLNTSQTQPKTTVSPSDNAEILSTPAAQGEAESVRSAGAESSVRSSKRRSGSELVSATRLRKRSTPGRFAQEAFIVTPLAANSLLGNGTSASGQVPAMETMQLFLVVNVSTPDRGMQLMEVDGGEPLETFDLRRLRYASRFRLGSSAAADSAVSPSMASRILALAFADETHSRVVRRFFEMESEAIAGQLLGFLEPSIKLNCTFKCVSCSHEFVWFNESLVYDRERDRDGDAGLHGPASCPRCGGRFISEVGGGSTTGPSEAETAKTPATTNRIRKKSLPIMSRNRMLDAEDESASIASSQQSGGRLARLRSVKMFRFDEETFGLVDSDLKLLFSLSLLDQDSDEEVQLLFRCHAIVENQTERSVAVEERDRDRERNRGGVAASSWRQKLRPLNTEQSSLPQTATQAQSLSQSQSQQAKQQIIASLIAITNRRLLVFDVRLQPEVQGNSQNVNETSADNPNRSHTLSDRETIRLVWQNTMAELRSIVPHPHFDIVSFTFAGEGQSSVRALRGDACVHAALLNSGRFNSLFQSLKSRLLSSESSVDVDFDIDADAYRQSMTQYLSNKVLAKFGDISDDSRPASRDIIPVCVLPEVQNEQQLANVTGQFALLLVTEEACILYQHNTALGPGDAVNGGVELPVSLPRKHGARSARARGARRQLEDSAMIAASFSSTNPSVASSFDSSTGSIGGLSPGYGAVRTLTQDFRVGAVLKLADLNIDGFSDVERGDSVETTLFASLDVLRLRFVNEASGGAATLWISPLAADGKSRLLAAIGEPWRALFGVPLELHPLRLS